MNVAPASAGELFIPSLDNGIPVAIRIAGQLDLPRLAADGAILHVRLPAPSGLFEVELGDGSAVGTHDRDEVAHV